MSAELDALKTQVQRTRTVVDSAVTLIRGLAQQIIDLKQDPAALQDLADQMKAEADDLGQAVSDNTPTPPPSP